MKFFIISLAFLISQTSAADSFEEEIHVIKKQTVKIPMHAKKKKRKGVNCKIHKLFCTIVGLNPSLNKDFAMKLSNSVYKASKRHGTDPYRTIAIAMQESSLSMINRVETDKTVKKQCDDWQKCKIVTTITKTVTDVGIFQFNINTMKRRSLSIERMLKDVDYAVNEHVKFLAEKIKMCKKIYPKTSWACYHSATKVHHNTYIKLVNRYYHGSN